MIPNDALINALRDLGYRYKDQTDKVMLYKKSGSTARVALRRTQLHDDVYARTLLRQAGMSPVNIEQFISTYRCSQH